jgi:hypothetical protein
MVLESLRSPGGRQVYRAQSDAIMPRTCIGYEFKGSLNPTDFRAMLATWVAFISDQSGDPIRRQALSPVPRARCE